MHWHETFFVSLLKKFTLLEKSLTKNINEGTKKKKGKGWGVYFVSLTFRRSVLIVAWKPVLMGATERREPQDSH